MTDDELKRLLRQALLSRVRHIVRSLLVGNDAMCFTTDRYKAAYQKEAKVGEWIWKVTGHDLAREHLLKSGLVREVAPDPWAPAN